MYIIQYSLKEYTLNNEFSKVMGMITLSYIFLYDIIGLGYPIARTSLRSIAFERRDVNFGCILYDIIRVLESRMNLFL